MDFLQKKIFFISTWSLLLCNVLSAQIKGFVVDSNKEAVIGATVLEKGSAGNGTLTDLNGEFSLTPTGRQAILQISYIGYETQEIKVSNPKEIIRITLRESSQALEEVVVMGYGVQKKVSLTGSVATVAAEKLEKVPMDNITNMIGGRLPGLVTRQTSGVPGDNASTIYIRGISTTGSSSPLVLVDGVERDFQNLDPAEIETFTVLKDAAAAAVYGVRAANGVILVTTKRGKNNDRISVTYNGAVSASTNANFPEFLDGTGYATWYNKALEMDGLAPQYDEQRLAYIRNGGGDAQGIWGNTNWFDLIFKDYAAGINQTLTVTGGNEKTKFFTSVGHYNQDGIIENVYFKRYNVRSNIDTKLTPNLDFKIDLSGRIEDRHQPGVTPGSSDPTASTDNGGATMGYKNIIFYTIAAKPVINTRDTNGDYIGYYNPLIARDESGFTNRDNRYIQSSASLVYTAPWLKGLKITGLFGYDFSNSMYRQLLLPYEQVTPVYETGLDGTALELRYGLSPHRESVNLYTEATSAFSRYTFQAIANYTRKIKKHDINTDLIWDQSGARSRSFGASRQNLPITVNPSLNDGQAVENSLYSNTSQSGRAGMVARINYAYADKYLVQILGRADWSSKFAPENRLGFFPAVSLGWRISEEPFMKTQTGSFLDNLKIRASWGMLGNDAISSFLYEQGLQLSSGPAVVFDGTGKQSFYTTAVANKDVTWEKTTTYNAGVDATFWGGLLSVEADVFYKVTRDILQAQSGQMPASLGGNFASIINSGIVDVRGYEIVLTHQRKVNQDFSYTVSANMSYAHNRIVKTDDSENIPEYQKKAGTSIGSVLGLVSEGLYTTEEELLYAPKISDNVRTGDVKYKDMNGDGKITNDDRAWIAGSSIPEYMFGINLEATWKNFDASLFFQGAAKSDVMLCGTYTSLGYSDGTFFTQPFKWGSNAPVYLVEGSWTPENTNAEYPRLTTQSSSNNNRTSDYWKRDASYLRLKNLQIGYSLPKHATQALKITNARLYVSASNLLTFSKLKYIDPEAPSVNNGYYPQQRVYSIGLNVGF